MSSTSSDRKLTLALDGSSGIPFYRQIIRQIELAVQTGTMVPGDRLPTIRSLAVELKMNPNTVAKAYSELEMKGIVLTQVGSGTYVSGNPPALEAAEREEEAAKIVVRCIKELKALGIQGTEVHALFAKYEEDV